MENQTEKKRDITVSFTEAEIAAVRDITKVDAVAPGVVAIVRRAIEAHKKQKAYNQLPQ